MKSAIAKTIVLLSKVATENEKFLKMATNLTRSILNTVGRGFSPQMLKGI